MKKVIFLLFCCALSLDLFSQKLWTLEECLRYAQENNLTIKQAYLNTDLSKQNLFQSKMGLLPSLNGNISDNTNFGRNIDPVTNEITVDRIRNNSFGLSSSVTLFNGFQKINSIRKSNYDYLASKYDAEKIANDISVNIVTAYLQLLYNADLILVSQQKVDVSELQVQRISNMVEVGSLPAGDLLNTEAQKAQEELQLIVAESQRDIALLNLKQLLDLPSTTDFTIEDFDVEPSEQFTLLNTDDVYNQAVENLPNVKSAESKLQSSEKSLAIAQGGRSPRLSMSASLGTAYSSASQKFVGYDSLALLPYPIYVDYSFEDQFNDNVSQSIGFNLSIPIFNAWQANSRINQAKIGVLQSQFSLQQSKNDLRKTIEQAQNDALSAHKKYIASKKTVDFQKQSFQYTQEKYDLQLITSYDYNNAKNTLFRAETDLLQAKYDYIFKTKMLDFYMGKPLTF